MVLPEKTSRPSAPKTVPKQQQQQQQQQQRRRALGSQSLPSPALCCACGLCIMLAGINITLVGAFAFGTFIPTGNPPIIIGPLLLLIALAFFTTCCVVSRRPPAHMSRKAKGGEKWGLMGTAAFEMETSEHTLQDTTAVQLSLTNSPTTSSHKSSSSHGGDGAPPGCQDGAGELLMSDMGVIGDNTTLTSGSKASTPTQMLPALNTSST